MSLTINFLFILSGPQFQIKLKHNLFSDFTKLSGGFGKAKNRWTNFDIAIDFMTVILPSYVIFRFDQFLRVFSTFLNISAELWSHMLKTSGVKVTPKILIGPWSQSSLYSLQSLRFDLAMLPIQIAFATLILSPDIR